MYTNKNHLNWKYNTRDLIHHIALDYRINDYKQVFGLIKLTWLGEYSKITGFNLIFNMKCNSIEEIVDSTRDAKLRKLLLRETGFVNFYKAYRNSAFKWAAKNQNSLLDIYFNAQKIKSSQDIIYISKLIEDLTKIPIAGASAKKMASDSLITPMLACLDPTGKFPIVNKNHNIVELHRKMGITNASLSKKVNELLDVMKDNKISDSIHLDDHCETIMRKMIKKVAMESKNTSQELLRRDDSDIKFIMKEKRKVVVRNHRKLEHMLISFCQKKDISIEEGTYRSLKYDALIKNYRPKRNLLVEIKGSNAVSEFRLALGQILDYGYEFRNDHTDLAILLPEKPDNKYLEIAKTINVKVLWIEGKSITGTIKI